MEGKYSFSSPEWEDISDDAKELIQKLLTVDRSRRFKAEDALMSSFFQQDVTGISLLLLFFIQELGKINFEKRWKKKRRVGSVKFIFSKKGCY